MKRQLAWLLVAVAAAVLSGCYYDPGYSYVRGSAVGGDAYYGSGSTYYAAPGYYDGYYSGYYPSYYNGYGGCCYAPGVNIGISGRWYGGSHYRGHRGYGDYRRGNYPRSRDHSQRGDYRGSRGHSQRGNYRGRRSGTSNDHGSRRGGRSSDGHHDHRH